MMFSIPNMQKWLMNKFVNCLYFEHTIFLTENVINFLLAKHQFRILQKQYFLEHSIFYYVQKDTSINPKDIFLPNEYQENKAIFVSMQEYYASKVQQLNRILKHSNKEIYLFGAHLFSQFLIYHGLEIDRIQCILDNDTNKWEKRLYGTSLIVKTPHILKEKHNVLLILNAGAYNEEIKQDILTNINEKVEILTIENMK